MADPKSFNVGQDIFIVKKTYRRNEEEKGYTAKISRVGRKFFYVEGMYGREICFCMETMYETGGNNYKDRAYLSEAQYVEECDRKLLEASVTSLTSGWGRTFKNVPTDKLKEIESILKEYP